MSGVKPYYKDKDEDITYIGAMEELPLGYI
jgi:hypothetical protein